MQILGVALALAGAAGCKDLPGTKEQQGAVIGGASGAAVGAVVGGSEHRLLGALLGGALGAGGGYLIGANADKITGHDQEGAQKAIDKAQQNPATPAMVANSTTADLNKDGFVTMDEVTAMKQAGLSDQDMLQRLRASGQVFELTTQQRQELLNAGISQNVVDQMAAINRDKLSQQPENAVGAPPATRP